MSQAKKLKKHICSTCLCLFHGLYRMHTMSLVSNFPNSQTFIFVALLGLPSCWLTIITYYIHDNQFTITPNILMLQCYISTAVWLALLFLYFHKLNCGEVEPLRIFLAVICFVWWWSTICISRSSISCISKRRIRISLRQVWQLVLIFVERW